MIVNRTGLAEVLGISLPTVDSRVRNGMPVKQRGDRKKGIDWEFDTVEIINWLIEQSHSENPVIKGVGTKEERKGSETGDLKKRRLEAETIIAELDREKKEIELAEKKGQLVNIDDANAAIIDAMTTTRQRLLSVPRRVTPLVLGETDDKFVKTQIENEIRDALNELAQQFESESEAASEEALLGTS